MSLKEPHLKMSKSHVDDRSRILINDTPDSIALKIRLALTDSVPGITYDPKSRPGVSNLLDLMSYFDGRGRSVGQLAQSCEGKTMREFKDMVASTLTQGLAGIRDEYQRLLDRDDTHYLEDIGRAGAARARHRARETMAQLQEVIGLG